MMQNVPVGGTLWTSFYASHFITVALQNIEGWRSDMSLVFRGHRRLDWSLPRLNSTLNLDLTSLRLSQDLQQPGSRFEVDRPLDSIIEFGLCFLGPILSMAY